MPEYRKMNPSERALMAAKLCCHFAQNFAYYSVFRGSKVLREKGFWLIVHGNFVDVCVLEWCKMFGNRNGKYHWQNVTLNPKEFRHKLLSMHRINDIELTKLWNKVKNYRDSFVAHLEEEEITAIPYLNVPFLFTEFYFRALQSDFPDLQSNSTLPQDFNQYYDDCLKQAQEVLKYIEANRHT